MVISISARKKAIICANNALLGKVFEGESLSFPVPSAPVFLCAYPFDSNDCVWCYLSCNNDDVRILPCNAQLCIIDDELATLDFFAFGSGSKELSPPIVTNEARWSGAICGICDGWFVVQTSEKTLYYKERGVLSFKILNELFALLCFLEYSVIIDRTLDTRLNLSAGEFSLKGNTVEEVFSSFSFFKLRRTFDARTLQQVSADVLTLTPKSSFETICCFCEAVRLGLKDEAQALMTPSLIESLDFDSVREFLGPFDRIERPQYKHANNENAFCLRYAFDKHNFHYICYEVEFDKSTGCDLIDNITEV